MKALLFVAHGSRKETSNEEIRQLALSIQNKNNDFDLIEYAFLELVEPDILAGGQKLIDQGASSIVVYPYFLVAGKHVVTDVPEDVEKIKASNPGVEITIAPYFGASESVVDQILSQLMEPKRHSG